MSAEDFADSQTVFQIGVPPRRIDLLCSIEPVAFDEAWATRATLHLDDLDVLVIGMKALLANKAASNRLQDRADAEALGALVTRTRRR